MAVTQNTYTGNGSTVLYSFTFPYLATTDVKVKLDGVDTTAYTLANATTVQMNSAPSNGAKIIIYRNTDNDNKKATFYPGSAIKAEDLNNNYDQILYTVQEVDNNAMSTLGDTAMQGDMLIGQGFGLQFEGATDDANETRLVAADPTADRTITLPNVTGNVVTTGDTGTVTDAMLSGGTALTSAEKTKLAGIATGAEVNVQSDWNASSGDAQILNKPTFTDTDTTYSISCVDGDNTDEEKIRLTAGGDGSGTDDIVLETGTGLSIARSGDKITFSNSITNTNQLTNGAGFITNNVSGTITATAFSGSGAALTGVTSVPSSSQDIQLNDNVDIYLGSGDDLKLFHNGTNSFIQNQTGNLVIAANRDSDVGGDIWIDALNGERSIKCVHDGQVELYYDGGTTPKLSTTSTGVNLHDNNITNVSSIALDSIKGDADDNTNITFATGDVITFKCGTTSPALTVNTTQVKVEDNQNFVAGTGNDLTIRHDATNSYIENTTGNLYIDTADTNQSINFRVGGSTTQLLIESSAITTPSGVLLNVSGNAAFHGNVDLHDNDNLRIGTGDDLKIYHDGTNSYIWNDTGDLRIFSGSDSDPTTESINCKANGHTSLYYDGAEKAYTHASGFKLNDDKILLIGTGNDLKFSHNGTVNNSYIQNDTGYLYIDTVNNVYIRNDSGVDTAIFDHTNGCYLKYQGNTKLNTHNTGVAVTGELSVTDKVTQTSTAVSALDIDCSAGNYFTKAISADSTFTFSNVPATGTAYGFVLELDVSGDRTLTWPTAVKWAGGSAPTLTAGKTHLFSLVTVDGGTTWRGSAAVDFTT